MTKAEAAEKSLRDMVDELGALEEELTPVKAKIQRADTLRRAMRAPYSGADPALNFEIRGARYAVLIGPAGNETTVNTELLAKLVGSQKFIPIASVSVRALAEHFGGDIVGAVTETKQTGPRKLQVVALAALARKAS